MTYFYVAIWYLKFQLTGFGLSSILNFKHTYQFFRLLWLYNKAATEERIYRCQTEGLPDNTRIAKIRQEFTNYADQPQISSTLSIFYLLKTMSL